MPEREDNKDILILIEFLKERSLFTADKLEAIILSPISFALSAFASSFAPIPVSVFFSDLSAVNRLLSFKNSISIRMSVSTTSGEIYISRRNMELRNTSSC
jgi:hypothetical protein